MKKFLKWFGIALGGLLIVAFAFFSYLAGSPRDAYFMVRYALPQMHRGHLKIGDAAPDARLLEVNGVSHFYLHQRIGARPLVLIFGSYTWPPFRRHVGDVVQLYNDYKNFADFLTVYVREAHPTDEWEMKSNLKEDVCYPQPKTMEQRLAIANDFVKRFHYPVPFGIDDMSNDADHEYAAWPERIYIIDASGRIAYRGGMGPFDYKPEEARAWLAARFGSIAHPLPAQGDANGTGKGQKTAGI